MCHRWWTPPLTCHEQHDSPSMTPSAAITHLCSFRSCSNSVILAIRDLCSFLSCWNFWTISSPSLLVSIFGVGAVPGFLSAMFVLLSEGLAAWFLSSSENTNLNQYYTFPLYNDNLYLISINKTY